MIHRLLLSSVIHANPTYFIFGTRLTEKQIFDKLAAFALTATDKLKGPTSFRVSGVNTKGYRMAIDNGQFSQVAR